MPECSSPQARWRPRFSRRDDRRLGPVPRMRALAWLICLLPTAAPAVTAAPLAWYAFAETGSHYRGTAYHWLGNSPLALTIAVAPSAGRALDLLWGAKSDQRGAEVVVNGRSQTVTAGGYDGFRWQRVPLPASLRGEAYEIVVRAAAPKAAFLAALRLVPADAPRDAALPDATARAVTLHAAPAAPLAVWSERLRDSDLDPWERALLQGRQANEALRRCQRYVDGWLAHADPCTGLIPRNLTTSRSFWNGRDAAADNYAFMVLTCALTDRELFTGRMREMLRTEARLTSRVGALPADYDFEHRGFRFDTPDLSRLIFDGSEYVKDGLMPITEWLGPTAWSARMLAIVDSILDQSSVPTPAGPIPADNVEVNGEMMQVLSRLRFMTGRTRYLDMACRIADTYLLGAHHPTRDAVSLRLRDHGCELISGLTEVYAACRALRPEKAQAYREPLHMLFDRILQVGVNEHGLMYDAVNPQTGAILRPRISDNWGYNYNGFYTLYLLDGEDRYRRATRKALAALRPYYGAFAWEGSSSDGIADAVEGALNLFNREPDVAGVAAWIDANIGRMFAIQRADGVIEGWHGDGNFARTAILWALWKQQGVTVQPWRADVILGAVRDGGVLRVVLTTTDAWSGRLVFDVPRHRTVMHLPRDYPRINQFPEWFTVTEAGRYGLRADEAAPTVQGGAALAAGLPVELESQQVLRLTLQSVE